MTPTTLTRHISTGPTGRVVDRPHLAAIVANAITQAHVARICISRAEASYWLRFARLSRLSNVAAFRPRLP
jgi:hypothetical protein